MNNLFNFKWLMATMLLCLPVFAWGDELEDITLSLDASLTGWGDNFSHDSETHVATFPGSYCGVNLYDEETTGVDYSDYAGVKVVFKTKETYDITLDVNYQNSNYSSVTITGSGDESEEQEIYVAFNSTYGNVIQIYLMCGGYYSWDNETQTSTDITGETSIELVSATVLVNAPETPESESTEVDLTKYSTQNWDESNSTITVNDDGTASLSFGTSYSYLGWWFGQDLSEYDGVEITYEDLSSGTINLYLQDSEGASAYQASTSDSSGTVTFVFGDHAGLTYSNISMIMIQSTEVCTVTITSMSFIKYTSSEGEGDDGTGTTAVSPIIVATGHDYLNTEWSETNLDDESTTTMTTGSNGQSATIEITDENGGSIAWKYEDDNQLDLAADYTGITVTYTFGSNEDDEQTEDGTGEGTDDDDQTDDPDGVADEPEENAGSTEDAATITLVITDSNNNTAEITGSNGTLSFNFSDEDYSSVDFSKVKQIEIKAGAACTLNISSIELVLWLGDSSISSENYIITKTTETTSDDGTSSTTYNYYLNLGVGIEIWSGSETESSGSLDNSAAATVFPAVYEGDDVIGTDVTYKGYWCGVNWNYTSGVDLTNSSQLTQLVITYRVAQTNTNETPTIQLTLKDSDGKQITVYGADATGTITCIYSNYTDSIDFTNIVSVAIQASVPCKLHILSAELQRGGDGTVVDQNMLLSQFFVWGDNNTYTYDEESDTGTLTLYSSWTGGIWYFDDVNEDAYFGVYVRLKTTATCKIRLTVEYLDSSNEKHYENYAIDGSGDDTEQWLFLPFDKDYDKDVVEIQLMCGDIGDENSITITLLSAELVGPDDGEVNDNIRRIKTSTNEGYGTYCCDKDFEMPEYLEGYIITSVEYTKSSTSEPDVKDDTEGDEVNSTDAKARVKKLAEGDEVDEGDDNDGDDDTDDDYDFSEGYYITIKKAFANDSTDTSGKYSSIVPAGVAILVKGCGDAPDAPITYTAYVDDENVTEGEEKYVASDEDKTKANGNLLLGNKDGHSSMTASAMQDSTVVAYNNEYSATDFYYYYLDYGKVTTANGSTTYDYLGFYWMNNDGSAFAMTSNRAWLPLLKSNFENGGGAGLKIIEYVEDDSEEQTTGITTVPTAAVKTVSDGAIYTIQGVRVNNMNKPGVYIVDGKKVIKK